MNINMQIQGFKSYERTESFIVDKLQSVFSNNPFISNAQVYATREESNSSNVFTEIRLQLKGKDLFVSSMHKTLEAALRDCIKKLKKQIAKYRTKRNF